MDSNEEIDDIHGKISMLTAKCLALQVRADVLEGAILKVHKECLSVTAGMNTFLWIRKTYQAHLFARLSSIEDKDPDLAAHLQTILNELEPEGDLS